jgi:DNA (cytosine-5)-methyltransferase 1
MWKMPYVIDLFCGAGGMSEGLIQAGFQILFSNDVNAQVMETYINRHKQLGLIQDINTHFFLGDVRNLSGTYIRSKINGLKIFRDNPDTTPQDIDAIFGGPPCQGFSRAGKRNSEDPRNFLFKEYLRIIKEINPKYVVMENVEGFLDTKLRGFIGLSGKKYDGASCLAPEILTKELVEMGYNVLKPKLLNASDYGVPQNRNRAIFIAYRMGCSAPKYPEKSVAKPVTVLEAIGDLICDKDTRDSLNPILTMFQLDSRIGRTIKNKNASTQQYEVQNYELASHSPIISERFSLFNEGEKSVDLRKRIWKNGIDLSLYPSLLSYCAKKMMLSEKETISQYILPNITDSMLDILLSKKNMRTRLNSKKPSLTVLTLPDDYISPFEDRIFTVRELARLQSFDDSFVFLGKRTTGGLRRRVEIPQYSQVGNAVPPLLAKAIANEISSALKKEVKI